MVNLGNGGTKDFVELWEIMHLKIWTHFSIRQTKLFWINFKHYSQRRPMLSPFKQLLLLLVDNHLSNATRDLYSVSQMKKSPSKTSTNKLFLQKSSTIEFWLGYK